MSGSTPTTSAPACRTPRSAWRAGRAPSPACRRCCRTRAATCPTVTAGSAGGCSAATRSTSRAPWRSRIPSRSARWSSGYAAAGRGLTARTARRWTPAGSARSRSGAARPASWSGTGSTCRWTSWRPTSRPGSPTTPWTAPARTGARTTRCGCWSSAPAGGYRTGTGPAGGTPTSAPGTPAARRTPAGSCCAPPCCGHRCRHRRSRIS